MYWWHFRRQTLLSDFYIVKQEVTFQLTTWPQSTLDIREHAKNINTSGSHSLNILWIPDTELSVFSISKCPSPCSLLYLLSLFFKLKNIFIQYILIMFFTSPGSSQILSTPYPPNFIFFSHFKKQTKPQTNQKQKTPDTNFPLPHKSGNKNIEVKDQ